VVELRIADEKGRNLPLGEAGRILIRSPLGGRPIGHMPVERYSPITDGKPFFDLGDDGYLDAAETLYVIGRRDGVVKIGGVRVDASGLERQIAVIKGVREVVVVGVQGVSGGDVLAVAVHLEQNRILQDIRTMLRANKGIESKAAVIDVGRFPVTRAQKIDLGLIKKLVEQQICSEAIADPPGTPAEHLVANCWAEVLQIQVPPRDIPFEVLGGDSLSLLSVALLLEQRYALHVPDQRFDECRTVASQAAALQPGSQSSSQPAVFSLGGEGDVVLACHAGIGGHAWSFAPLAKAVMPGVEVLAVSWTEAPPERLASDLKEMAKGRPVVPLGFSGGARTAWIVAQCLLAQKVNVPTVVILDGSTHQSIGKRHLGRAILRWLRPRTAADRYLLALSYAGRRWHLGKRLQRLPLDVCEVRCPDRAGNFWGDPELSLWSDFAQSVKQLDLDCEHQRIVKPPILPEVAEFVRQALRISDCQR
jgi:thioesterase domain-containing protein/acyl carrier protein